MQQPPNNQPWQHQPPYSQHPSFYNQPTQAYPPPWPQPKPLPHERLVPWLFSLPTIVLYLFIALIFICSMGAGALLANGLAQNTPTAQVPAPTATSTQAAVLVATATTAVPTDTPTPEATATDTPQPTATPVPTPTPQSIHYPPAIVGDLHGLAAQGNASAIHEFHSESVGLTEVCPQPKREVTVDPSVTGRQLAEDLLAYFYAEQLDSPCGSVVFAYHTQGEANDVYTAGRILLDVTASSGAVNLDPNATNLKYTLTLDIGGALTGQEYVVTY